MTGAGSVVAACAVLAVQDLAALTALFGVMVTLVVAMASGAWTVARWFDDRQRSREQDQHLAEERLAQAHIEEQHRRQDKAAELVLALGNARDETARLWAASALALYPDESLPLLVNAFAYADRETAAAIRVALTSIGPRALDQLCKMNRVATTIVTASTTPEALAEHSPEALAERALDEAGLEGARELLRCTRATIAYLLLQCDELKLAEIDLAAVDLSGMNFARANLRGVRFRKAMLERAVLARAKLAGANFRGAHLNDTVLTRASADRIDLTGASGAVRAIKLSANDAVVQDARLAGSTLDAAEFRRATLLRTNIAKSTLAGADLGGASITNCDFSAVDATHARLVGAQLVRVKLGKATLSSARLGQTQFKRCRLTRIDGSAAVAPAARFVDCDLGGAELSRAVLTGAAFVRCNLSGARLDHAKLDACRFERCKLYGVSLVGSRMAGAVFAGGNEVDASIALDGTDWGEADFSADPAAEAAFAAAAAARPASS